MGNRRATEARISDLETPFSKLYKEATSYLLPAITPEVCEKIGRLNIGFSPPYNFGRYLELSEKRYLNAISRIDDPGQWLEIGALWPALPITLARLGFEVTVAEEYSYYPPEIQDLYQRIESDFGVRFVNQNMSAEKAELESTFDYCSLFAVLEHLPYTPQVMLENVRRHLKPSGSLFIDVPNVYYAHNVLRFLRGYNVQPAIEVLFDSEIPFVGHHREYCVRDLRYVLSRSGFSIEHLEMFNYSPEHNWLTRMKPVSWLENYRPLREVIFCEARPNSA